MSISTNALGSALPDPIGTRRDEPLETTERRRAPSAPADSTTTADLFAPTEGPVDNGVEPELWALLSNEERAWYLRGAISGPATYDLRSSNGAAADKAARLGARLDVRA